MHYKEFLLDKLENIKSMYCRDDHDIRELSDFNKCINELATFIIEVCELVAELEKTPTEAPNDAVNHPSHYTDGKIEVIEFIEDKELGFHLGNAIKYISRAGKKDPTKKVEDIKKAIWYLERYLRGVSHE